MSDRTHPNGHFLDATALEFVKSFLCFMGCLLQPDGHRDNSTGFRKGSIWCQFSVAHVLNDMPAIR